MQKGDGVNKKKGKVKKESVADKILRISDFLETNRTAEEIKKHLKDKMGYSIELTDIRVNLLYLLRREKVKRSKDGAEYKYHV